MKNGSTAIGMRPCLARGRPTNPARIPAALDDVRVIIQGGWYQTTSRPRSHTVFLRLWQFTRTCEVIGA